MRVVKSKNNQQNAKLRLPFKRAKSLFTYFVAIISIHFVEIHPSVTHYVSASQLTLWLLRRLQQLSSLERKAFSQVILVTSSRLTKRKQVLIFTNITQAWTQL